MSSVEAADFDPVRPQFYPQPVDHPVDRRPIHDFADQLLGQLIPGQQPAEDAKFRAVQVEPSAERLREQKWRSFRNAELFLKRGFAGDRKRARGFSTTGGFDHLERVSSRGVRCLEAVGAV